jgi:hypothetical protein
MLQQEIVTEYTCDMCGKVRIRHKLPHGWATHANNKHSCNHCKWLRGKKPHNLSTLEIRRCLSTMKGGHHGR